MSKLTKEELKTKFQTGDKPTEKDFSDLIDTMVTEEDFNDLMDTMVTEEELKEVVSSLPFKDILIFDDISNFEKLYQAFERYDLENKLDLPLQCLVRVESELFLGTLTVQDFRQYNAGFRLTFFVGCCKIEPDKDGSFPDKKIYSPDASLLGVFSYLLFREMGYMLPLGKGSISSEERVTSLEQYAEELKSEVEKLKNRVALLESRIN